jgi:hypothetical protein
MQGSPTGIELQTKYFILSFLIVVFPLVVTIDGQEQKGKWGTSFYPVAAGNHDVSVAWKMYWLVPVNKGATGVTVAEGQVARLLYKVPLLVFLKGKLEPAPAA